MISDDAQKIAISCDGYHAISDGRSPPLRGRQRFVGATKVGMLQLFHLLSTVFPPQICWNILAELKCPAAAAEEGLWDIFYKDSTFPMGPLESSHVWMEACSKGVMPVILELERRNVPAPWSNKPLSTTAHGMTLQRPAACPNHGIQPEWEKALHAAASNGHLEVVKWLCKQEMEHCSCNTIDNGRKRKKVGRSPRQRDRQIRLTALDVAARNGHASVVQWLHANSTEGCTSAAMDGAAMNGHLPLVQWLHAQRTEGCTTKAMDWAAMNGHLHVVQWLHRHRNEGCTTEAMDKAAKRQQLEVLQWLHTHRSEGCTTFAMDGAATEGHLSVLQWLHEHRSEGCTRAAIENAAREGHTLVVQWLYRHYLVCHSSRAAEIAEEHGHVSLAAWLRNASSDGEFRSPKRNRSLRSP
jgi:hypothetical protein